MKLILTEQQYNKIFEMAYPVTFNMDEFKQLRSFAERFRYCKQRLEYISSGSGRYVFGIDEEKVLKLAKNQKGVAQNEQEYDMSNSVPYIVAKVFDADDNYLWIEMERVNKITIKQFEILTGLNFREFQQAIRHHDLVTVNNKAKFSVPSYDEMWENEFFMDIADLIGSYDMPSGDLMRINSYGVNKRGEIKLIDAGLSSDIYDNYYARK